MEKRQKLYEELNLYEGRETALLIDTHRYLDLLPCNQVELKSMGYLDLNIIQQLLQNSNLPLNISLQLVNQQLNISNTQSTSSSINTGPLSTSGNNNSGANAINGTHTQQTNLLSNDDLLSSNSQNVEQKSKFLVPDSNQMLPFKPLRNVHAAPPALSIPTMIPPLLSPTGMHHGSNLFAFPTMIIDFIKRLPPPYCFNVTLYYFSKF